MRARSQGEHQASVVTEHNRPPTDFAGQFSVGSEPPVTRATTVFKTEGGTRPQRLSLA